MLCVRGIARQEDEDKIALTAIENRRKVEWCVGEGNSVPAQPREFPNLQIGEVDKRRG